MYIVLFLMMEILCVLLAGSFLAATQQPTMTRMTIYTPLPHMTKNNRRRRRLLLFFCYSRIHHYMIVLFYLKKRKSCVSVGGPF